jgi:hypothetical protein
LEIAATATILATLEKPCGYTAFQELIGFFGMVRGSLEAALYNLPTTDDGQ